MDDMHSSLYTPPVEKQYRFNRKQIEKTTVSKDTNEIQSLQGWMRKLEQSNGSISSRLLAVENRISLLTHEGGFSLTLLDTQKNGENLRKKDSGEELQSVLSPESKLLDQLTTMTKDIENLKEQLQENQQKVQHNETEKQQLTEHLRSIENEFRKHSVIMNVHGKEIPVEIVGIIVGLLVFLIAGLVLMGGKDIVMSPGFLGILGCILIGSSVFRSVHGQSILKSLIQWTKIEKQ